MKFFGFILAGIGFSLWAVCLLGLFFANLYEGVQLSPQGQISFALLGWVFAILLLAPSYEPKPIRV